MICPFPNLVLLVTNTFFSVGIIAPKDIPPKSLRDAYGVCMGITGTCPETIIIYANGRLAMKSDGSLGLTCGLAPTRPSDPVKKPGQGGIVK